MSSQSFKKSYSELIKIPSFEERFEYLKMDGQVGIETFGIDRYLNQMFYNSPEWKQVRRKVILRDNGCDLAHPDRPINGRIIIHHMNPITLEDILQKNPDIMNPEYLISTTHITHNGVHYGDKESIDKGIVERKPNDTCPWKQ